ncbi:hypothetical protein KA005_18505 [bacterium]|nr:hypothetical protein [bacterium]
MKKLISLMLVMAFVLSVSVCALAGSKGKIVVGTKDYTEQWIDGWLVKLLLEDRGYDVKLRLNLPSPTLRAGMKAGDIDMCVEYDGTAYTVFLDRLYKGEYVVPWYAFPYACKALDLPNGFTWIVEKGIYENNTWAVCVSNEFSKKHNVYTVSDMAKYIREHNGKVKFAMGGEFYERPDALPGLEKLYNFKMDEKYIKQMTIGLTMGEIVRGNAEIGMIYGTDPHTKSMGLTVLKDDKNFWPPYNLFPVVRTETLKKYPELKGILLELLSAFSQPKMLGGTKPCPSARAIAMEMNYKVDLGEPKMSPEDVAREFLVKHGLIK